MCELFSMCVAYVANGRTRTQRTHTLIHMLHVQRQAGCRHNSHDCRRQHFKAQDRAENPDVAAQRRRGGYQDARKVSEREGGLWCANTWRGT